MSDRLTMERIFERVRNMELQRNIHISLKKRYVYVAVPKAANSTIKWLLQTAELRQTTFEVTDIHDRLASPLIAPFQLPRRQFLSIMEGARYTLFTCVRDPFSRVLSCYLDRIQATRSVPRRQIASVLEQDPDIDISFPDFVRGIEMMDPNDMNEHFRPQSILTMSDIIDYDHVIRFESLSTDLPPVLSELYGSKPESFAVNENKSPAATSAAEKLAQFYDEDTAEAVRRIFAVDFETFGYSTALVLDVPKPVEAG